MANMITCAQAYAYANGRPLVNIDPDGRFVVDYRSLRERCCGDCDDDYDKLKQKFESAVATGRLRGRSMLCSQHFEPDGVDWILGGGSGPSLDFDTEARYRERYAFAASQVESFNAFTYLQKVHITCERMKGADVVRLARTLLHEGYHTNQPMFMPVSQRERFVQDMERGCGF